MCLSASMTDAVLIDLAVGVEPSIEVVFIDTRYHFPETLETVERVRRHYGLNLRVLTVPPQPVDLWKADPANCCSAAKIEQLDRALVGKLAWMSGLRRAEAPTRAGAPIVARDLRGLVKVNPIATWTDQDVAGYIADHDVPVNPLLAPGLSLDRLPPVHPTGRGRGRRRVRAAGPAPTRRSAACTSEHAGSGWARVRPEWPDQPNSLLFASLRVRSSPADALLAWGMEGAKGSRWALRVDPQPVDVTSRSPWRAAAVLGAVRRHRRPSSAGRARRGRPRRRPPLPATSSTRPLADGPARRPPRPRPRPCRRTTTTTPCGRPRPPPRRRASRPRPPRPAPPAPPSPAKTPVTGVPKVPVGGPPTTKPAERGQAVAAAQSRARSSPRCRPTCRS